MLHLLLRFRQHKFAVSADIEGIFLQVGVPHCDQPSLARCKFPSSHHFGSRDSPTCANFALQQTARDNVEYCNNENIAKKVTLIIALSPT